MSKYLTTNMGSNRWLQATEIDSSDELLMILFQCAEKLWVVDREITLRQVTRGNQSDLEGTDHLVCK